MKKKIRYKGVGDGEFKHYVLAVDKGEFYIINEQQYLNCLRNREVLDKAGIKFEADKPVYVINQ